MRHDVAEASLQEGQPGAVKRLGEALIAAWNVHDIRALGALFSADASFVTTDGQWWCSRSQIESELIGKHQSQFRYSRITELESRVTLLAPTVAALQIRWELVRIIASNGSSMPHRTGTLLLLLTRAGEGWQIEMAQNTNTTDVSA